MKFSQNVRSWPDRGTRRRTCVLLIVLWEELRCIVVRIVRIEDMIACGVVILESAAPTPHVVMITPDHTDANADEYEMRRGRKSAYVNACAFG